MSIPNFIDKMTRIQKGLLKFIKSDNESDLQELTNIIQNEKSIDDKYEFKSFLHLISKISNNHYRTKNFYDKIDQILSFYREQIQTYFTNNEIFNIFKSNKRILLFLFNEKIIIFDKNILYKISKKKYEESYYSQYFMPEINSITKNNDNSNLETIPDDFEEKRKKGENDLYICELIRNDSVIEFITFVNKNNISLNTIIKTSIYETNSFLIKNKEQSLIEYAAFFGSIQIFQFLLMNKIELKPSLWKYVIHGQNNDLIHLLENKYIECSNEENIIESIKCHHNKLTDYFFNFEKNNKVQNFYSIILKYYNFEYLQKEMINKSSFLDLCKNDYFLFVQNILPSVNINEITNNSKEFRGKIEDPNFEQILILSHNKILYQQKSALHVAVEKENIDIIKLLLSCNDIDVNLLYKSHLGSCIEDDQKTALHIAVKKSNPEIVKLLLSCKKIDVNCIKSKFRLPYYNNETALHIAVENENTEIVLLLLSCKNIDVNIYMESGSVAAAHLCHKMTALFMAVKKGNLEIVNALCSHKSTNIELPFISSILSGEQVVPIKRLTLEEKTPMRFAQEQHYQDIYNILMKKQ
ncbi:hypothetical protein M9Y10_018660 [Tritrichomonas musculus]|uniref:DUF3447 domain-containing protein n=1 Tax=Tritrichomonas musculus TaxID=1915356 RepID=A0ABR2HMQ8_9EUKA